MTLDWIDLPKNNTKTRDNRYAVHNSTIWMHSRIVQQRYDATHDNGKTLELIGSYPTPRAAIEACEQHAQGHK